MLLPAYISFLINTPLFSDIEHEEAEMLLQCLDADVIFYSAGEVMLSPDMVLDDCCIILSGSAKKILPTRLGSLEGDELGIIEAGELYGASTAVLGATLAGLVILAVTHTAVLRFPYKNIPAFCSNTCTPHKLLIDNYFRLLYFQKDEASQRIEVLSKRSIRDKLLCLLRFQQGVAKSSSFTIPFNREELGSYLGVDRSALSRELSNMQEDGLIAFKKNMFTLHENA